MRLGIALIGGNGSWYSGTADKQPVFGEVPAVFRTPGAAQKRSAALTRMGHVTEVRFLAGVSQ